MTEFNTGVNNAKLNIIFVLDSSGSMIGARIGQLNLGVRECLDLIRNMDGLEEVNVEIRIMQFDGSSEWVLGSTSSGLNPEEAAEKFKDITANRNITCTHDAIGKISDCLKTIYAEGGNNYMPIIILVTDGQSTYPELTKEACENLKKLLHGHTHKEEERTIRISIGVEDANRDELIQFASCRNVVHSDGTVEKDVPNVFEVDEIENLRDVLRNITINSISNSISAGSGGSGEFTEYEDDSTDHSADPEEFDDGVWEDL